MCVEELLSRTRLTSTLSLITASLRRDDRIQGDFFSPPWWCLGEEFIASMVRKAWGKSRLRHEEREDSLTP
jgi:hypothetical protein